MADPTTTPSRQLVRPTAPDILDGVALLDEFDAARERREELKSRHSHALIRLLEERDDLRGVHPLADLVADSLRWSA